MGGNYWQMRSKYRMIVQRVYKRGSLLFAIVIVMVAILVHYQLIDRPPLYHPLLSPLFCVAYFCFAVFVSASPLSDPRIKYYIIIPYHFFAAGFVLLVSGFLSPITLYFLLLAIVVLTMYSYRASLWTVLAMSITALISIIFAHEPSVAIIGAHVMYVLVVAICSWFVSRIVSVQDAQQTDLVKTEQASTSSQSKFMTLLNSTNEAIISISRRGVVQFYNAATLNLLDTNQNLTGKHIDTVFKTFDQNDAPVKLMDLIVHGAHNQQRDDLEHAFSDGEHINLDISISAVRDSDGDAEGYMLIIRDITHEKSLDEERDEFVSVVSHELRTPVTISEGTISNVMLLLQKHASPQIISDALRAAHEQITFLSSMINDLSTLSRAEQGSASEYERVDLAVLARELHDKYQPRAGKKSITLDLDLSPRLGHIVTSRLYLEEILQNFLTNAIKYTEKGGVTLSLKRSSDQVTFTVTDTGIGISKSEQKKVFNKFYRAEDYRTRETSGTGLGLYIVQKLARKLGTHIVLESRLNRGSSFAFSLPLSVDKSNNKE